MTASFKLGHIPEKFSRCTSRTWHILEAEDDDSIQALDTGRIINLPIEKVDHI